MKRLNKICDISLYDGILSTDPLFPKEIIKTYNTDNMKWYVVLMEFIDIYFTEDFDKIDKQKPIYKIGFVNKYLHNIELETLPKQLITIENNSLIMHHNNTHTPIGEIIGDLNFVTEWVSEINEINNQLLKIKKFYEKNDLFNNFRELLEETRKELEEISNRYKNDSSCGSGEVG